WVDESVRAGVVLYAIDTRGLNSLRAQVADGLTPTGTDDPGGPTNSWPGGLGIDGHGGSPRRISRGPVGRAMFLASETGRDSSKSRARRGCAWKWKTRAQPRVVPGPGSGRA